ncbi:MAG: glycosyltransferase [Candidatus Bathyarchaeota archaeon]|nr:glycosyltransferase [Candidatus Bathyarchaeota archaeon]
MPQKIGVFCPTLNVYGGGEYVAVAIANALAENNQNVTLFSSSQVDPKEVKNYFGESLNPAIEAVKQTSNFKPWALAGFYQTILQSILAKSKCNLLIDVFSNCVFPWAQVSYIHYPFLNKDFYRTTFPYLENPHLLPVGALPHVFLEKNLTSFDDKLILANSHYTAGEIKKYQNKPVEVLYPPFSSVISKIGKTTLKNPKENLVVTTSRFAPAKMLERIPQIAAKTRKDINFAIIGRVYSSETLFELQKMVKQMDLENRVKFYPDASAQQKFDLLKRAKVYLHTMVGEHFGISIVEAMALGCIPLVHNSGGMVEIAPVQYRYETRQQAAEKIDSAISGWSEWESLYVKELAQKFSLENFSVRFLDLMSRFF